MNAFHAYDIRGVYNRDFNAKDVYRIGYFLPQILKTDKILVGRDVRVSSPEIFEALERGLHDAGATMYDAGLCTTPMVYFGTGYYKFHGSVMITASHNAKEYNGLKISRQDAKPVGYDAGLKDLEQLVNTGTIEPKAKRGTTLKQDVRKEYLKLLSTYTQDSSNMNIAIDCSNGMAGLIAKDVFGTKADYIFEELDGSFPNHQPNPLIESNSESLKALMADKKSDIGLLFDGDADRVVFIDNKGRFVSPDLIIALMGKYFLKDNAGGNVLQDIRSSKSVGEYVESLGGTMHTWRVGRAFASIKLRELNAVYGGELAGHYYFRDFYYSDSAMIASLIVVGIISEAKSKGISFASLIDEISNYENSGEINFEIQQKAEAMEAIKEHFFAKQKPTKFMDFDGYRIEYADWWLSIRPSNTEPYLRLLVEATNAPLLSERLAEIKAIIARFN